MRAAVLVAFALTVWLCGPRAVEVLAARYQQVTEQSPAVDLDHVGFLSEPAWLNRPLLVAVTADLGPSLQERVPILDEPACRRVQTDLERSAWVRSVAFDRVFPDRFRLQVELRRPVLGVRDAEDAPLCLVDGDGIALPWVDAGLPSVRLYREGGSATTRVTPGYRVAEARVLAAAAIAVEWRDQIVPLVADCPTLLEVDTTNLGERWMRGRSYPEVRVVVRRNDGEPVIFAYGRPVDSTLPRVAVQTKATVLLKILTGHPGLAGLVAGDLRFANRWADYLQPRGPDMPDPDGPWHELDAAFAPPSGGR